MSSARIPVITSAVHPIYVNLLVYQKVGLQFHENYQIYLAVHKQKAEKMNNSPRGIDTLKLTGITYGTAVVATFQKDLSIVFPQ
ncbi:MAG: hypothetical protein EZS28_043934 [Streblomastix strix]|uniref:Uncharacterized protein n=1 Tax=Streblomastix strix TaxID=222440 RepID=A0A5J4TRE8_9EUKA|nr:MAG: hypothetical protein EZS28_043934 [Streblomastix strix]